MKGSPSGLRRRRIEALDDQLKNSDRRLGRMYILSAPARSETTMLSVKRPTST